MRVNAFLCDSAEVVQGKIYALGAGWNVINVRSFPAVHRRLTLAATVHVPFTATNEPHRFEVKLVTEDGKDHAIGLRMGEDGKPVPVHGVGGEFTLGRPVQLVDGDEQVAPFAFPFDGLRFTEPGMFSWVLSIDGEEAARLAMRVQQAPQA
ncbi:hypothetical protein RN607_05255 [Demequina capsici]|uniref:Uncharacterized protein n=1 Tax=Demequina capsici TaxID=3075620 RepID=A0AA96FEW5_9MICO|nr:MULTISPECIES: hypothetical protein [unclassified Demequina]WNM25521.1 hypothetical protein RN606_05070 [Demequina sp. OYTSA14]WNM28412.1 hypothetical protein RN607_05255 [Demequina sp. PMTSA13]